MSRKQPSRTSARLAQGATADCRPSLNAADRRPSCLSQLTVPELRQRLKESGLSASGPKAQLVERLQTQDDQHAGS
jgi:hypothetical protein